MNFPLIPTASALHLGRCFALLLLTLAIAWAAPAFKFPPGVDWTSATPEQIRQAVFEAVKEDPENAVEIVQAAMEMVQQTGRFPNSGAADGKQQVADPDDGIVTLPEIADQIAQGAIQANPVLATQITQAVNSAVASAPVTQTDGGGTDGGGGGGGSAPPALPGGFGGGGGGGGGSIYSN